MSGFNPNSYQMMANANMGMYSYPQRMQKTQPVIPRQDFMNKGHVMHDNMGLDLRLENITEYQLYINSIDRDTKAYPDPFKFRTTFDGIGAPEPKIDRKFRNIKYFNIDQVFLPRTNIFTLTDDTYSLIDSSGGINDLTSHRFLILRLEELSSTQIYSTGFSITDTSFILVPDQCAGDGVLWKASCHSRVFPTSSLGKISKLTPVLYDEFGNQITIMRRIAPGTDVAYDLANDPNQSNPNSDLIALNKSMQVYYAFTLGVIEIELNTLPKFER